MRYLPLLALLAIISEAKAQSEEDVKLPPRLVINIIIDQLRGDYLEVFSPLYGENGLKRLMREGRVFENAVVNFKPVDRASSAAAITTGTFPYYNGITSRRWLNRSTLRPVMSTEDREHKGLNCLSGSSAQYIATSTLGDELKVGTAGKGKVWSIAAECDAAVINAGHAGDGAVWIDDENGKWCSSDYYYRQMPSWLETYSKLQSPSVTAFNQEWQPYNRLTGNVAFTMGKGSRSPFTHKFTGPRRYADYKTSGLVNYEITKLAQQCISSNEMGYDALCDLLSVTYYAGTFLHKSAASYDMELQDTYVRLDAAIGELLDFAIQRVGYSNLMVVVSGTGYYEENEADYTIYKIPTGTVEMSRTASLLNMYLGGVWGLGTYVDAYFNNQIYLNHKLIEQKQISHSEIHDRCREFLAMLSGIRNVYTSLQLLSGTNLQISDIRNGFNPQRCGDIIIDLAPGWMLDDEQSGEHWQSRASYVPFPIIFFGGNIEKQHIKEPADICRIAPTISKSIHIRAPNGCAEKPLF